MGKKQTTIRVDEHLFAEFSEFCESARLKQEGVIEGAIYLMMHGLEDRDYISLMHEATDYIKTLHLRQTAEGRAALNQSPHHYAGDPRNKDKDTDSQQLYDKVRKIAERPAGRRRRTEDAG